MSDVNGGFSWVTSDINIESPLIYGYLWKNGLKGGISPGA